MILINKLRQSGGSLVVTIDKDIIKKMKLKKGDLIKLDVIEKIKK